MDDDVGGNPLLPPAPYFSSSAALDSFGDCGRLYDDLDTEERPGFAALGLAVDWFNKTISTYFKRFGFLGHSRANSDWTERCVLSQVLLNWRST